MIQIRPGRSWRHNPTYASELSQLNRAEVRAFDGGRILDVLGIEVDGVDIAAGVGEAPLCTMVDELVQAALHLARGEPAAQATVGPGPTQMVLEPRGPDLLLTLFSLRPPGKVLAGGLLVDAARLRAAALGAAQRVLADLFELCPALRGADFVRRLTRDLRELSRARSTAAAPWPPERPKQAGFVARGVAPGDVRLEVRVPADAAARLAARALAPHAPLAPLLGAGSLALRFGLAPGRGGESLGSQPSRPRRAPAARAALALSLEAPPFLALRALLRSAEELVRAFESGEPSFLLRWGEATLRCDLTRDELRAEGLRDPVHAPPLALAEVCATAARAFARRALALGPKRPKREAAAAAELDAPLRALEQEAAALLKHCRDLASGDLRRAPESVRSPPLPLPAAAPPDTRVRGSLRRLVHRLAFELQVGPIAESGLHLFPAADAAVLQSAAGLVAIDLGSSARLWHLAGVAPGPLAVARAGPDPLAADLFALVDDALLRLDPASGESRFRRVVRGAGGRVFAVPGGCAVTLAAGGLALVRDGGALAFRVRLPEEPELVRAHDGVLLAQLSGGQLVGLDALEGAELWRRRVGVRAGPALLAGGRVLACAVDARRAHRIVCLDRTSGETLWERPLPPTPGQESPGPLVQFGERCAVLAGRGVAAFSSSDGAPAFTRELPWGASGRLAPLHTGPLPALSGGDPSSAHALLALGPGAAALQLDERGQPGWSRPALSATAGVALSPNPAQQGPALLLADGAAELIDAASGRTLARPSMADTDAAGLLPDLGVVLHLRDGTLALMRLATHLSLV